MLVGAPQHDDGDEVAGVAKAVAGGYGYLERPVGRLPLPFVVGRGAWLRPDPRRRGRILARGPAQEEPDANNSM